MPNPTFKVSPTGDGLFLIDEDDSSGTPVVQIVKLDTVGDTLFARRHTLVPTPVPDRTVDSTVAALVDRVTRTAPPQLGSPSVSAAAIRDDLEIPDHLPPVEAAAIDRAGGIWLETRDSYNGWSAWHVIDSDGNHASVVIAPHGLQILRVRGDEVWGVELNRLDVPSVIRYIARPSSAR